VDKSGGMIALKNIVFVAGESVPFCKTGGLADVVGTLPKFLKRSGINVCVFLPFYRGIKTKPFRFKKETELKIGGLKAEVVKTICDGVSFYFIKQDKLYDREQLYATSTGEYADNALRFAFFGKAVLEAVKELKIVPDIFHIHDWHTGVIPVWIKKGWVGRIFEKSKVLITIHNLAYQGWFAPGKKKDLLFPAKNIRDLMYKKQFNFLYWGLKFSDWISTVSPTYSTEITQKKFGCGLDWLLRRRKVALSGILNGIDYKEWNPATDEFIFPKYSVRNLKLKEACKKALLTEHHLQYRDDFAVIGAIGRLTDQKGWDIIAEGIEEILKREVYFIILGTGEERYHNLFKKIAKKFPEKTGINIKFDNKLAHRIYAGSDFFLMPSQFEPCGLGQLISFKYGTIPIVNPVGGLKDTVTNKRGILLKEYSATALINAVDRAVSLFKHKNKFLSAKKNIMALDFSWTRQTEKYIALYRKITRTRRK